MKCPQGIRGDIDESDANSAGKGAGYLGQDLEIFFRALDRGAETDSDSLPDLVGQIFGGTRTRQSQHHPARTEVIDDTRAISPPLVIDLGSERESNAWVSSAIACHNLFLG